MGFLRLYKIISIVSLLLFAGCSSSLIKTSVRKDDKPYPGFGRTPAREFYISRNISDSLLLKWQNDTHGSFDNSSVAIYDSLVFINDLSGRIYCFHIGNGDQIGQLKNDGAVFTTPYVYRHILIYTAADDKENITHLRYYDFSEGDMKYDIEVDGRCTTEIIGTPQGVIFNTENGIVYKYDMGGNEVWQTKTNSVVHSSPSMADDIIVFGNDSGEVLGIDGRKGKILYRKKIGESFFGASAILGNKAYIGNDNGSLYSINLHNGDIVWKYKTGARIIMTPSVTVSKIYFGNLSGDLFCLNKDDGSLIWETSTGGILNATPYAAENLLVVPDLNKKFYFVNVNNGNIEKTYAVDGRNKLSPVIFRNLLFIGFDRGELQVYEFK
jgi:outer membrane protein assembly factor BamB